MSTSPAPSSVTQHLMNNIEFWSRPENGFVKRHLLTRTVALVATTAFASIDATYNIACTVTKLPVALFKSTIGKIYFPKIGKIDDKLSSKLGMIAVLRHAYKTSLFAIDAFLGPLFGFLHPKGNIALHIKLGIIRQPLMESADNKKQKILLQQLREKIQTIEEKLKEIGSDDVKEGLLMQFMQFKAMVDEMEEQLTRMKKEEIRSTLKSPEAPPSQEIMGENLLLLLKKMVEDLEKQLQVSNPKPEPVVVEPEPKPVVVEPKPEPEPVIVEPEPQPVVVEPNPEPEPVIVGPEPELSTTRKITGALAAGTRCVIEEMWYKPLRRLSVL